MVPSILTLNRGAVNQAGTEDHYTNLAELLPDEVLDKVGGELFGDYTEYKNSRSEWEQTYTKGLDLLGFKYTNPSQPFEGASGATHPVLAEAVTQFQAGAYKELLPADGPVRTQILGAINQQKQEQGNRVKDFMNYQLMDVMKEYEPDFDQMLFYLPLAGSAFKKVYYDELLSRAVSKVCPCGRFDRSVYGDVLGRCGSRDAYREDVGKRFKKATAFRFLFRY